MEKLADFGVGGGLAALAFWMFIAAVVIGGIWDSIRKREAQHETVRRIIESGQQIDQQLIDKLLSLSDGRSKRLDRDFKITALCILPTAVGMAFFAGILGSYYPGYLMPLLGVAALLACIGIGFWVAANYVARWYIEDSNSANTDALG